MACGGNLKDDANLKAACEAVLAQHRELSWYQNWLKKLSEFLRKVQDADQDEFCSPAFKEQLWGSEVITKNGHGHGQGVRGNRRPSRRQMPLEYSGIA